MIFSRANPKMVIPDEIHIFFTRQILINKHSNFYFFMYFPDGEGEWNVLPELQIVIKIDPN